MTEETSQPAEENGNIRDRIRRLQEEASELSDTLDGVEKSLQQAAGESKE